LFFSFFILAALLQILYYGIFVARFAFAPIDELTPDFTENPSKNLPDVTIIICAHNEAKNLKRNLPKILLQQYAGNQEVIIVLDRCTDNSLSICESFLASHPYISVEEVNLSKVKNYLGKKDALSIGISKAKYPYLLLTDADCQPTSSYWLKKMAAGFDAQHQVVIGHSPYESFPSTLNKFIQYETLQTAVLFFTHAFWKVPYMGTGRNIAYQQTIYKKVDGFKEIGHIVSGDDDLFVSKIVPFTKLRIQLHPDSFCYSTPKFTWSAWIGQKLRHVETGVHYRLKHKLSLGTIAISQFLFYIFLPAVFFEDGFSFGLVLIMVKYLLQSTVLYKLKERLKSPLSIIELNLLEFVFAFYYVFFGTMFFIRFLTKKKPVLWIPNKYVSEDASKMHNQDNP